MKKGIICFETGEFAKHRTSDQFDALPLLQFMQKAMDIEFIYRQIATREELMFYLKKIGEQHFLNSYGVVYFSFHGAPETLCFLQSGKSIITLDELGDIASQYNSFNGRHVHFSTCETLNCEVETIKRFKRQVKAKTVSGYTESVDSTAAFINELAYFHQIFEDYTAPTIKKHMSDYQKQLSKLGFKII